MTNTKRLLNILKDSGKYAKGTNYYNESKKQSYRWDEYYINTPFNWVVKLFDKAAKENNIKDHRNFDNGLNGEGLMQFHCAKSKFKGQPSGIMIVKILIFT